MKNSCEIHLLHLIPLLRTTVLYKKFWSSTYDDSKLYISPAEIYEQDSSFFQQHPDLSGYLFMNDDSSYIDSDYSLNDTEPPLKQSKVYSDADNSSPPSTEIPTVRAIFDNCNFINNVHITTNMTTHSDSSYTSDDASSTTDSSVHTVFRSPTEYHQPPLKMIIIMITQPHFLPNHPSMSNLRRILC